MSFRTLRWSTLLALAPSLLLAQTTGTVRGRVTSAGSGAAIADAQVSVAGTQRGTVTNANGEYSITRVPAGDRTVSVP